MNRLYTIPTDQYCERARWAVERAKVPFIEIRHLPVLHYPHSLMRAFSSKVPILKTSEGTFKSSDDVLIWANQKMDLATRIYPEDSNKTLRIIELEKYYTEILGPAVSLWLYPFVLSEYETIVKYSKMHQVPAYELGLLPLIFPVIKSVMRSRLKGNPQSRSLSKRGIEVIFNQTAAFLEDGRTLHLGDRFSAADLTFASMAAPVLLPDQYGVALPKLDELRPEMAEQVYEWRRHPAGQFALRIYRDFRK